MLCPYCNQEAVLVKGKKIYPHRPDLSYKNFWQCEPCDAHVGCHKNTKIPLGTLANDHLRLKRLQTHQAFDTLWEDKHFRNRSLAYAWLASKLDIPTEQCHIGMFDKHQCNQVLDAVADFWKSKLSNKDPASVD